MHRRPYTHAFLSTHRYVTNVVDDDDHVEKETWIDIDENIRGIFEIFR